MKLKSNSINFLTNVLSQKFGTLYKVQLSLICTFIRSISRNGEYLTQHSETEFPLMRSRICSVIILAAEVTNA